jgi:hypothetical protein
MNPKLKVALTTLLHDLRPYFAKDDLGELARTFYDAHSKGKDEVLPVMDAMEKLLDAKLDAQGQDKIASRLKANIA